MTQSQPTAKRTPVSIDPDTDQVIQAARMPESPERSALAALAGRKVAEAAGQLSEAATVSALVELGKKALREEVLEAEYAAIAAEQTDEDREVRAAMRGRRFSPRAAE